MSLKCMIGKWLHKGQINQEEYDAVIQKLEGHDAKIRAKAYQQGMTDAIDEFVRWAYVHGIDFSFMGKIKDNGTSDVPERLQKIKNDFWEQLKGAE